MPFFQLLLLGVTAGLVRGHGQHTEQKDGATWDAKSYAEQHVSPSACSGALLC
jgi:hypothetical protein